MSKYLLTKIEFLKGVGPIKASLLNKELSIYNYGELIKHFPFRLKKYGTKKSPLKRGFK